MSALANGQGGLVSVIIPCFNQLEFTRLCVPALFRHTKRAWELVAVDNGSTDATASYLAGVRAAAPIRVELIVNAQNRGFPAACNQGIAAARGDYVVLLNNDAVVTDSWADQLVALADSSPKLGMTGPMSNYVSPPQLVDHVPYADLDGMHQFADRWRREHRGQWRTANKLSGFCLLIKRRVLEVIGGLDERFGLGFFDDDDLALRATRAGFELAIAFDLFVHHFGSRTFAGAGIDAEALLGENQKRFAAKWGLPELHGQRVTLKPWSEPPAPAPTAPTARPKVSLTMIVRNEEHNLPACLSSAQGIFDEIVVVDTGSKDRTQEIARSFGARVFDFIWVDDFAAARNAALARATGDYAFWLDADDVIDPPQRERLRSVLGELGRSGESAYVVRCSCDPDRQGGGGETVVDHIRLFPIREEVRWTYRVHEQILPSLREAGVPVRWTDVVVRHTGYTDLALRHRKLGRDEAILRGDLEERPNDPFVLFNLGSIAIERQDWAKSLEYLRHSLAGSAPTDSITRKLYALIARSHQMLREPQRALQACAEGLSIDPEDAELLFREAVVRRNCGDRDGAERCWRKVLSLSRPERFSSVDQGIYGHLTRRNLAALAEERGAPDEARQLWTDVLGECPGDHDASNALQRLAQPPAAAALAPAAETPGPWIVPGSRRALVPTLGPEDFDPYAPLAAAWVRALRARVVVELGVRFGDTTRAFLAGASDVDGHVWGVDPLRRHDVVDPRFTFLQADPTAVTDRWNAIDLLHIDIDPHGHNEAGRWLQLYADRCRAIAIHDTHHPVFRLGALIRDFAAATGQWQVFEYWGNAPGWTVLARNGEPSPADDGSL
jgi:glycosyltransferase involved in cell wall biosynthesis